MRRCLGAAIAAPSAEACCVFAAGIGGPTAASERCAEGDVAAARVLGAGDRINVFASWLPFGLEFATDSNLESDNRLFGFAQPERGQHEVRTHGPEVQRAEFLLTIGYGLPRGP